MTVNGAKNLKLNQDKLSRFLIFFVKSNTILIMGATGFDGDVEFLAACRVWESLVKHLPKKVNGNVNRPVRTAANRRRVEVAVAA